MGNQNHQHQVVKVRRETIEACMTCPLCNKLLRDATTISECLHTFCRKCIYQRISDEGLDSCPICNINLGCIPLEKLRPDHNLQDVRSKIFPYKRRKVEAPEVVESVTLPVIRRKERSLSSLVVSTPKVSTQTTTTGRRTKPFPRKAAALRGSGFSIEKPIKKEHDRAEDSPESSSSPETPKKFNQNTRQNSSSAEPSQPAPDDEAENGAEPRDGKSDLWQPLNFLVEVANRTKSFKSIPQVNDAKLESRPVRDNEPQVHKTKFKENKDKSKVKDEKNNIDNVSEGTVEPKRLRRIRRKKAAFNNVSGISSPAVLHTAAAKQERRNGPVWFSLLASEEQEGDAPLPQIPSSFLRLKDGNVPVSFIQKYLVKKLDLTSEVEVEIRCMGRPVIPTLLLRNLVDQWLQAAPKPEQVPVSAGSSAKDFVMVLAYARKVPNT
ncbi:E3 ubiquitin protein ligase DRIP2-like [Populus alba x Populus x berolinensis]|uniref:Zinc finger family protein n=3 Tax=Populus TaxID=3689 RepID=A0A4V6A8L6_POPAL|nr:E3 ubiquitin protein ligase DRIP2-like [Populus alba]KAJ6920591.1 E3 ubiquitin protein ligase DRIP2-like [Populus alba x Populus x berolinensis]KAJ6998521.1 E3 ubiquitin protein ligase DRIP2-like [Populus alba x Populus x berolinensis]TKS03446.1 zinc finger family protein [Populus alba]